MFKCIMLLILFCSSFVFATTPTVVYEPEPADGGWFVDAIKDGLRYIIDFLYGTFLDVNKAIFEGLLSLIPMSMLPSIGVVGVWLQKVDCWFPVFYGLSLLIAYYEFLALFVSIKWLIKFLPIPGVG